jgi:prepilin-type N-terminal cleavage/methylation domain-containing protein
MLYNCKELKHASLGFTLIELLIVVLIISILAAVALPQYRKVVNRAAAAEQISNLKAISNAVKLFKLTTGRNPADYGELDISFPGCSMQQSVNINYLVCNKFSSVIESSGRAIFIGPLRETGNYSLGLSSSRHQYVLYMPIDTEQIICVDAPSSVQYLTCADIGFTKSVSKNCFWPPCYMN